MKKIDIPLSPSPWFVPDLADHTGERRAKYSSDPEWAGRLSIRHAKYSFEPPCLALEPCSPPPLLTLKKYARRKLRRRGRIEDNSRPPWRLIQELPSPSFSFLYISIPSTSFLSLLIVNVDWRRGRWEGRETQNTSIGIELCILVHALFADKEIPRNSQCHKRGSKNL